jgi:hypothetical protein
MFSVKSRYALLLNGFRPLAILSDPVDSRCFVVIIDE